MTGFTELSKKEALEDLQLITANYNGTKKVDENDLTAYAHDLNEDGNDGDRIDYRATIMEIN